MARKKAPASDQLSDDAKAARFWIGEIQRAQKKFKEWNDKCDKIVARYRDERNRTKQNQRRFNILWSNVQTMKPAVFANTPKPVIERRFLEDNEIERIAGQTLERAVEVQIDEGGYFAAVDKAVLDYLLCGRGVSWVRYEAEFDEGQESRDVADDDDIEADPEDEKTELPSVTSEQLCVDYVDRKDYLHDLARTWEEVGWLARRLWLAKPEATTKLGEKVAKELVYQSIKQDGPNDNDQTDSNSQVKKAELWQIWDKKRRKVWVISPGYDGICDQYDDPLKLKDFWPCPKPLYATMTNDTLVPVPDYLEYQDQAEEIDDLTRRIDKITQAIKAAGVYDASQPSLKRLLQEGVDNVLIPCETWSVLKDKGGLQGSVELFPLDMLIKTLQVLYEARDKAKDVLYEVTGISDIIRGQGAASETATAQRIKGQFATLRLQDRQKAVATFCRDLICIMTELIAEHFSPVTLAAMTAMADKSDVEMLAESILDNPQQISPEQLDAQKFLKAIEFIKDDRLRSFRLDIETDSTIQPDQQAEQQARSEFLASSAQFLTAILPVAQQKPELMPLFGQMMLFGARGFKASRELESVIEMTVRKLDEEVAQQMGAPRPNPELTKVQGQIQLEQIKQQGAMQREAAITQRELIKTQGQLSVDREKHYTGLAHEAVMASMNNTGMPVPAQGQADGQQQPGMTGDPSQDGQMIQQALDQHMEAGKQGIMQMVAQHMAARQQQGAPEVVAQQMRDDMLRMQQQQSQAFAMMAQAQNDAMQKVAMAIAQSSQQLVTVAQLLTAPKRVIRNEDGVPIGVETVTQ